MKLTGRERVAIDLCDDHDEREWPSPGCAICEIETLRQRLLDEAEGWAVQDDLRAAREAQARAEDKAKDLEEVVQAKNEIIARLSGGAS